MAKNNTKSFQGGTERKREEDREKKEDEQGEEERKERSKGRESHQKHYLRKRTQGKVFVSFLNSLHVQEFAHSFYFYIPFYDQNYTF